MSTLHLLTNNAGFDLLSEQAYLITPEDALVLMAEAVYLANDSLPLQQKVYVLQEDMQLRGMALRSTNLEQLNYPQLVALTAQFDRTLSW
ncbi:DsrH/TusB family sulfur relay protein [Planctobacterium marinum]|uniref:DsrH/TusB family sulfur relay protein n=1 Tax=Planctobacterium marinum TaxID=1631968 RepID=UPI001E4F057C|nr:DsrH/TusB family sulfur metabolism protein [Planctobacterium marinum]MCC2604113.1 hypothetical protein [Planctobacterium marinum]